MSNVVFTLNHKLRKGNNSKCLNSLSLEEISFKYIKKVVCLYINKHQVSKIKQERTGMVEGFTPKA